MDKILVHATSLDNLSNILLSRFLAHPSLAILNNEQKQSSTKSTPLEHLSFNFGNVVIIDNLNYQFSVDYVKLCCNQLRIG